MNRSEQATKLRATAPSSATRSGGVECGTHHWALDAWDLLFHLGLFATFFNLFFYFRLRKSYSHGRALRKQRFGGRTPFLSVS